jgi:hypothetical protein
VKVLIILILLVPLCAHSGGSVWLEAQHNWIVYDDSAIDKNGQQFKALAGYKWVYLWAALDQDRSVDWGGQDGPAFELASFGAGIRVPIVKTYFHLYGEAGRYLPRNQDNGIYRLNQPGPAEAIHYYGQTKTGETMPGPSGNQKFDTYQTDLDATWGGEVGAVFQYPVYCGLIASANIGYRFAQLPRHTEERWDGYPNDYWTFDDNQSISGWVFGLALNYSF